MKDLNKQLIIISGIILSFFAFSGCYPNKISNVTSADGPDPIFEKPAPITMSELSKRKINGVAAVEVNDYLPCGYKGELTPSPPHADLNPKKAVIFVWEKGKQRFVFSHEASYCPLLELPSGMALCNQFYEGNFGWAELLNATGRRERNSFVDIIKSGPDLAWVRWTYFCVNKDNDNTPALRGTEDYISYPNGLIWRRMTYQSLMPDKAEGYSYCPIEFFAVIPPGVPWHTLVLEDKKHGDYHVAAVLDLYSDKQYDVYYSDPGPGKHGWGCGKVRRRGDATLLKQISQSKGFAMVMPCKEGYLFSILGDASGIPSDKSQVTDQVFKDTAGLGWGAMEWDHWPVGWLNAQGHAREPNSPYPYAICQLGHYITNKWLDSYDPDYTLVAKDMKHNKWTERRVFYMLTGAEKDFESIRRLGRQWLDKGKQCASAESVADLR